VQNLLIAAAAERVLELWLAREALTARAPGIEHVALEHRLGRRYVRAAGIHERGFPGDAGTPFAAVATAEPGATAACLARPAAHPGRAACTHPGPGDVRVRLGAYGATAASGADQRR
jgi:hypothetical protein